MAFTDAEINTAFNLEVGTVLAALTSGSEKIDWFNEGVNRLAAGISRYKPNYVDITWALGDRLKALPSDFIEVDKIVTDAGYVPQPWRVFGTVSTANLRLDDSEGATQAGAARVFYWSQWPLITFTGGVE